MAEIKHQLEQQFLEYSDRVIFAEVRQLLAAHGKRYRFPSNAQLSGLFQMARGVQTPKALFATDPNDDSFENFINNRAELAKRRRSDHEEHFFTMVSDTLFGAHEHALRRATSALLTEIYSSTNDKPPKEDRAHGQVFLFQEWMKHFYLKAKFLNRGRR